MLQYIARKCPHMAGGNDADFFVSQQLCAEAEDVYQKLGKMQDTCFEKEKVPKEELEAFWTDDKEDQHNKKYGIRVYLKLLEAFYHQHSKAAGRFTSTGRTIG